MDDKGFAAFADEKGCHARALMVLAVVVAVSQDLVTRRPSKALLIW